MNARVLIAYKHIPAYRVQFFESLRDALKEHGVELVLAHGDPISDDALRKDAARMGWTVHRSNSTVRIGRRTLIWQPVVDLARQADLVIVEQASKLLVNYVLLAGQTLRVTPSVALWGHGANLQPHTASRVSEYLKRRYSRLPHWWFAYTDGCRERVASLGYPYDRITTVQNSIDTQGLRADISALQPAAIDAFLTEWGATPGSTALFLGSVYEDKRLDFLITAARQVRAKRDDFTLLIAGDGPALGQTKELAKAAPWIRFLGRVDGSDRALALRAADCILMPGLVGLAILDSFAAEAPLVTTDVDFHSPEIEYLEDGVNGLVVSPADSAGAFADTVLRLLEDVSLMTRLRDGCRKSAEAITNEAMVANFEEGILQALAGVRS